MQEKGKHITMPGPVPVVRFPLDPSFAGSLNILLGGLGSPQPPERVILSEFKGIVPIGR